MKERMTMKERVKEDNQIWVRVEAALLRGSRVLTPADNQHKLAEKQRQSDTNNS